MSHSLNEHAFHATCDVGLCDIKVAQISRVFDDIDGIILVNSP